MLSWRLGWHWLNKSVHKCSLSGNENAFEFGSLFVRILLPVLENRVAERIEEVDAIIRSEVNVKEIRLIRDAPADSEVSIVKKVKPDFKAMGPRFGKRMKAIAAAVSALDADSIADLEKQGSIEVNPQDGKEQHVSIWRMLRY